MPSLSTLSSIILLVVLILLKLEFTGIDTSATLILHLCLVHTILQRRIHLQIVTSIILIQSLPVVFKPLLLLGHAFLEHELLFVLVAHSSEVDAEADDGDDEGAEEGNASYEENEIVLNEGLEQVHGHCVFVGVKGPFTHI